MITKKRIIIIIILIIIILSGLLLISDSFLQKLYELRLDCEKGNECPSAGLEGWYARNFIMTNDGGKPCITDSDCESICLTPLETKPFVGEASYTKEGYLQGACYNRKRVYGCFYDVSSLSKPYTRDDVIAENASRQIQIDQSPYEKSLFSPNSMLQICSD